MGIIPYIKEALRPGGTPKRFLIWSSVCLLAQHLSALLPMLTETSDPIMGQMFLGFGFLVFIGSLFIKIERIQLPLAYAIAIVGICLCPYWIHLKIAPTGSMIYLLSWSFIMLLAERRGYFKFNYTVVFMVFLLLLFGISLFVAGASSVIHNAYPVGFGTFMIAITVYLIYIDFDTEKNFYAESRQVENDMVELSQKMSDILTRKGELNTVLWNVCMECAPLLDMEDCVIYLYDDKKSKLVQVAAYGELKQSAYTIQNSIDIEPGKGIVGNCFATGEHVLVQETQFNPNYIVDDKVRKSELAVPIFSKGKVIGVLDSEHSLKGFFRERHLRAFQVIASFCGMKITEVEAFDSIRKIQIAEEQVDKYKELDQLKNRFITNISHDLKTPLSLIKAPAMQIASISENPKVQKHSEYILKNTEHLLRVVNQLLQLNRLDKGLNELYLEEIRIDQLLEKVKGQYLGLAETQGISFQTKFDKGIILTDAFRLEQIIHNLVHNAFRYSGNNGKVELTAWITQSTLKICVSDNGPGISEKLQSKVFERFFKADVNNHEGTGIGLSLVKEYTESLNGKVSLESLEGKGTTFTIQIPLSAENKEITFPVEVLENEETGKPIILVVEDHADLNNFICTFFEDDFHCISAFDGEEAMEKLKVVTPDIIISDLMMPKMNGTEFIAKIKESDTHGHIPVIVLTAKSQTESKIDLYQLGADNYLIKPFDINELGAVVNGVLDQRKKLKILFRQNYLGAVPAPTSTPEDHPEIEMPLSKKLEDAVNYVMENLSDSALNIKSMSKALGFGRNRFQKEIKEITGLTPVEFVRSVRLNEAKKMLEAPSMNVSEAAYAVGFNNLSYFTRSFKTEFDMLPSDWQEACKTISKPQSDA